MTATNVKRKNMKPTCPKNSLGMIPGKIYNCPPVSVTCYEDYYRFNCLQPLNFSLLTGFPTLVAGSVSSGLSVFTMGITYELIQKLVHEDTFDFVGYSDGSKCTILKSEDARYYDDEDIDEEDMPPIPF